MISKYEPLYRYLKYQDKERVFMSFLEVEEVLGFTLPISASRYHAWWDGSARHTQAYAWTSAGYKALPDLKEKKVEFKKYNT